jgi:hypothetical protein
MAKTVILPNDSFIEQAAHLNGGAWVDAIDDAKEVRDAIGASVERGDIVIGVWAHDDDTSHFHVEYLYVTDTDADGLTVVPIAAPFIVENN